MAQKLMLGRMNTYTWYRWLVCIWQRLKWFFFAIEIKDKYKVTILLIILKTKAYGLLWSINASAKPTEKTDELVVDTIRS